MPGRILVADDVATNRILLKVRLQGAHYRVDTASCAETLFDAIRREPPDLVILDASLGRARGVDLCRRIKSDSLSGKVPVVLLTPADDAGAGVAALEAGAEEFLAKPYDEVVLLARVRSLMRAQETEEAIERRRITVEELGFSEPPTDFAAAARIAFVPRDLKTGILWREAIRGLLRDPIEVLGADAALTASEGPRCPDLFLIDANVGQRGGGLALLSDLRSRRATRHSAFVIQHPRGEGTTAAMALDLGANDVIAEGFPPAELAIRLRTQIRRKRDADRLRSSVEDGLRLAVTDPLTGLYNRRYALSHLGRIAERAAASGRTYAVMVADIDRFKKVNDTYGHAAGDAVLVEIARRLRENLRAVDLIARIGGEEFLVGMPDTDAAAAAAAAERLRRVVSGDAVKIAQSDLSLQATISIGVAVAWPEDAAEPVQALIERADHALLGAKMHGRNQVTVSRPAA